MSAAGFEAYLKATCQTDPPAEELGAVFNPVLAGIVDMKSVIAGRIVVAALRTLAAIGEYQKSRRTI